MASSNTSQSTDLPPKYSTQQHYPVPTESIYSTKLLPRPQSLTQRACSTLDTSLAFNSYSYSLVNCSKPVLARRIIMIFTLIDRKTSSGRVLWWPNTWNQIAPLAVGNILTIVGFLPIAWRLVIISEAG